MKTVELFSGTQSFSKVARERGHETFCVDNDPWLRNDLTIDLTRWLSNKELIKKLREADIIWMSPPCTTFSMASGNTHWNKDRTPKTEDGKLGKRLLDICWEIAKFCLEENKIFFIENPRARARWFLPKEYRKTVWYCQYGDKRAKPTDIWTNLQGWEGKQCKNGNPDHIQAPRGSKTGTQGLKGSMERGMIPEKLCLELIRKIEDNSKQKPIIKYTRTPI